MALIIEDGSLVTNADSYVSVVVLNSYLLKFGVTTTATDSQKESYLLRAMQYLESFRNRFKGTKVSSEQSLQWPRQDVKIDNFDFLETAIPTELINAQCQLVVEQINGKVLFPLPRTSVTEGAVIEKTVGPLTKKFAAPSSSYPQVSSSSPIVFASVGIFLNVLLCSCRNSLQTVRI